MKTCLLVVANGSEEIEAISIADVLRRAKTIEVTVASIGDSRRVVCSRKCVLEADALFKDVCSRVYDCIALPGGLGGAQAFAECVELIEMLREQKKSGRIVAAICASPALVLAPNGLIEENEDATCYPSFINDKLPRAARHGSQPVVVSGRTLVTSRGPGTSLAFAVKLVEILCGEEISKEVSEGLLLL